MSQRETKSVVTPVGKDTVVLNSWITGREKRAISQVYLDGASFDASVTDKDGGLKTTVFKGDLVNKAQDASILAVVVSINDKKEDIVNTLLDMRAEDYEFVINEINKITSPKDEEELKK